MYDLNNKSLIITTHFNRFLIKTTSDILYHCILFLPYLLVASSLVAVVFRLKTLRKKAATFNLATFISTESAKFMESKSAVCE